MEEDYINKYDFLRDKSNVLYWGYDEDAFKDVKIGESKNNDKIIVHAGNMFAYQNPKNFWKQIKIENDKGNKFIVKFIGSIDKVVLDYLHKIGLKDYIEIIGFVSYPQMIKQLLEADAILVCASEPRHVPGKLFEALRTGNPIIAFGDNNEEVKSIITEATAGMMFGYNENGEKFLKSTDKYVTDQNKIKNFDRSKISKHFENLLNKV